MNVTEWLERARSTQIIDGITQKKNPLYAFSRLVVRALSGSGPISESAAML